MVNSKSAWTPTLWQRNGEEARSLADEGTAEPKPWRSQRFQEPSPGELARRYSILEQAAVFFTLPERSLRAFARRMRTLRVDAGGMIVQQGDPSSAIFFVESGHCQLRLESEPDHSVAVAILDQADFFGELSCVHERLAATTAVALDDCRLLVLDRTALYTVLAENPVALAAIGRLGDQRQAGFQGIAAHLGLTARPAATHVTALYSPKGGSGRTTLALNVAATLAQRHPGEVVLLDLSFPYTQAALLANLVPVGSLARIADAPPESAEEILLSAVLFHPASLMILPGCIRPEEADLVTAELVARALVILRRNFRHVVVDLGIAMTEPVMAVLDEADRVLLVIPPELAAVKAGQDAHKILTQVLALPAERITVVSNSRSPRSAIKREALERRLGLPVAVDVAYDGVKPDEAALRGRLLAITDRSSAISRAARRIADILETADEAGVELARLDRPRGRDTGATEP